MSITKSATQVPTRVSVLVCEGFSLHTFSIIVDVMQIANRVVGREVYRVQVIGDVGSDIRSDSGIAIRTDATVKVARASLEPLVANDMLFVCTPRTLPVQATRDVLAFLREASRRGANVYGMDAGAIFLAQAGLLHGRRCTLHWQAIPRFVEDHGTRIEVVRSLFVLDSATGTCAGGAAAADMILNLIQRNLGTEIAYSVSERVILEKIRVENDRQRLPLTRKLGIVHEKVVRAIDIMMRTVDGIISVDHVAAAVGLSRRQLERLFRAELRVSPSRYHLLFRLEEAHLLLTTSNLSIVEVGQACGFVSSPHFTKTYKSVYGAAPQQTRQRAREGVRFLDCETPHVLNGESCGQKQSHVR